MDIKKFPLIIPVSGKAEHGKDEFGKTLKNRIGEKACILHYGSYVKHVCTTVYGWNGIKDETGRTLLQYVGTDLVRKRNKNFWVKTITDLIEVLKHEFDYFIIPDTRFVNEIEYPKEAGYNVVSVRVVRPLHVSRLTEEQLNHESETALDDYQFDEKFFIAEGLENVEIAVNRFMEDYIL